VCSSDLGYQHNPLLKTDSNSGTCLNKYSYVQGIRLWIDQASSDSYINNVRAIADRVTNFEDNYSTVIEDVDPEVLDYVNRNANITR